MKPHALLLITLMALLPASLAADDSNIDIIPGKKVLYVSDFDCRPTTSIAELLELFPELLGRTDNNGIRNYDIQIDGVSTVGSKDEALLQFLACDINKIEVSQSPDMTQQQKGQGGVINIIPKDFAKGVNGSAALKVGSRAEVAPVAKLNYKTDKIKLRSSLMMRYDHPHYDTSDLFREKEGKSYEERHDSCFGNYWTEHANLDLIYKPDTKNTLKSWVWQSLVHNTQKIEQQSRFGLLITNVADSKHNNLRVNAGTKYTHNFEHSTLNTKLEYNYTPSNDWYFNTSLPGISTIDYDETSKRHFIGGVTDYKYMFKGKDAKHFCDLIGGFNYSYSPLKYYYVENETNNAQVTYDARSSSLYLSPYVEANSKFGAFFLKGGARYQYYHTYISDKDKKEFDRATGHATAFINFGWHIAECHNIGLNVDRSIRRPGEQQQFPFTIYIPSQRLDHKGNPELKPVKIHQAILNYVFDNKKENDKLMASASVQFITSDNLIRSYIENQCIKYHNQGYENTLAGNAMLYYKHGIFSISLLANVFQNWANIEETIDKYFYYNLSAVPMLHFQKDWMVTARFTYNSNVHTCFSRLSDYFYSQLSVSKSWNRWTLSVDFRDIFHKKALDYSYNEYYTQGKYYNLRFPSINICAMFLF